MVTFYLVLALLTVHELDATYHHEWRLLPILKSLPDETGRAAFVLIHIPLFWWVQAATVTEAAAPAPTLFRIGFDVFALVHVGLHYWLRNHPANSMNNAVSWVPIGGAAVAGTFDLCCL